MSSINATKIDEMNLYKERLTIAMKAAKVCVFEVDLTQQLYTFFENAEDIFRVSGELILKEVQSFSQLSPEEYRKAVSNYFAHPEDEETIEKAFNEIFNGKPVTYEARMKAGDTKYVWCKIDASPIIQEGVPVKMIGVITDISHIKRKTNFLKEKAIIDSFTRLYNKQYSIAQINKILNQSNNQSHAFVLLDIDSFKEYNDQYGHFEGDKAIKKLANAMRKSFRSSDILGRFGGDEFMILIKNVSDKEQISKRIESILHFQSGENLLSTSIGIAMYPQDAANFQDLLKKADKALYYSKKEKKSFHFFSDINTQEIS